MYSIHPLYTAQPSFPQGFPSPSCRGNCLSLVIFLYPTYSNLVRISLSSCTAFTLCTTLCPLIWRISFLLLKDANYLYILDRLNCSVQNVRLIITQQQNRCTYIYYLYLYVLSTDKDTNMYSTWTRTKKFIIHGPGQDLVLSMDQDKNMYSPWTGTIICIIHGPGQQYVFSMDQDKTLYYPWPGQQFL